MFPEYSTAYLIVILLDVISDPNFIMQIYDTVNTKPRDEQKPYRWLCILPIVTFILVPGGFVVTFVVLKFPHFLSLMPKLMNFRYIIASTHKHLKMIVPMISETGEQDPENFVFAIIVNLGCFAGENGFYAHSSVVELHYQFPTVDLILHQNFNPCSFSHVLGSVPGPNSLDKSTTDDYGREEMHASFH